MSRVQAIVDYRRPQNVKEVQKFLGICTYDRAFCPKFSALCEPLTRLLSKKCRWQWGDPETRAFEEIKNCLSTATMLYRPDPAREFCMEVDASDSAIAGQLFQMVDGERRPVAWASRLLLPRETRYSSNEKEILGLVHCLFRWRVYLLGRKFTVYTDNRGLTYINSCRLLSPRITRWALSIQEYDMEIKYIEGSKNCVADALSRFSFGRFPTPNDKCFKVLAGLKIPAEFKRSLKAIGVIQDEDAKLKDIKNNLDSSPKLQARFVMRGDVLYCRQADNEPYLLCVPSSLIPEFCKHYHEAIGHFGAYKTFCALRNDVWFTNMRRVIKRSIRTCELCQKSKHTKLPKPPINPVISLNKGDLVALDLYGPLPRSRAGVAYLLVVLDVFTKFVALYPLKKATTRSCLNRLLLDYFPKYGLPKRILSDQGTQFTARLWSSTLAPLGIQVSFCSVRHPQSNGSERVMRELGRLCRVYCHSQHTRWALEVKNFAGFLNSVVHESTGFTPNELQLGTGKPSLLPASLAPLHSHAAAISLDEKLVLARETLQGKAARRKANYASRPYQEFLPGDLVLLRANNVSSALDAETKKMLLLFTGPFKIKEKISFATYVLVNPSTEEKRGTFHASHLRRYFC